jgi:hypothetical protein
MATLASFTGTRRRHVQEEKEESELYYQKEASKLGPAQEAKNLTLVTNSIAQDS